MQRFALFVDGSNLFGSLKSMRIEVQDYQQFYRHVYVETVERWRLVTQTPSSVETQLRRIYWYVVGSMDDRDLNDWRLQEWLRKNFELQVGRSASTRTANLGGEHTTSDKAWGEWLSEVKDWYAGKWNALNSMRRFYDNTRSATDLIDIIEAGHWKVNFARKSVDEKGLDTSLAVDMIAHANNFDVAVVLTGDADSIPSIRHLKSQDKHVCAVEFVTGTAEAKGEQFSSRLKAHADFVVRIYESKLILNDFVRRPANTST